MKANEKRKDDYVEMIEYKNQLIILKNSFLILPCLILTIIFV